MMANKSNSQVVDHSTGIADKVVEEKELFEWCDDTILLTPQKKPTPHSHSITEQPIGAGPHVQQ